MYHTHAGVRHTRRSLLGTMGLAAVAGCLGDDPDETTDSDEFVFVVEAQDDPEDVERDWSVLADWIEQRTDIPMQIDIVPNPSAAIGALGTGQAHASYLSGGPSWAGWKEHGFETLAVEADEAGNTHYVAAAYTRPETGIETMRDAKGKDSAHTGDLTGAGMLIPVAYLAAEGLVSFNENDDVTAIRAAVEEYFGNPVVGGGYVGALQALSEKQADIAFGRRTTPQEYCAGNNGESWCLDHTAYEIVHEFTEVPSHPVLASTEASDEERSILEEALLALNEEPEGREILSDVFGIHGLTSTTSASHLGSYGELLSNLPGIEDHLVE